MAGNIRHIELWKQLEKKAEEATKTRKLAEETLTAAEKLIEEAKSVDANVTEVVAIMTEASTAVSDKDYKLAFEKATECKEKAIRVYRERIRGILDSNKLLLELVKSVGGDASSEESAVKLAEEAFQKDDLSKAVELAKESWKRSEKILHEHISKMFSNAQSLILTAKNSGKDAKMAEELLIRAREAMDASDYDGAIKSTRECLDDIGSTLKDDILANVDDTKSIMDLAKDVGYDIKRLETSIQRVEEEMGKYAYDTALHYSKQTKTDAEKTLKRAITERLDIFRNKLKEAEKIDADVSEVEGTINETKEALKEGNYQRAVTLIKEADEAIDNAKFEVVLETVAESREKFVTASNVGADIAKPMDLLNRARESLKKKRFEEALRLARKSDDEIDSIIKECQELENDIKNIQKSFALGDDIGADTKLLKARFEEAQRALKEKNFDGAVEQANEIKVGIEKALTDKTLEKIGRAKKVIDLGDKMGIELPEVKDILERSIKHAKDKEFETALKVSDESKVKTEEKIKEHITNSIAVLKETIETYIMKKEDAAIFNETLMKAKERLNAGEYENAYKFTSECTENLGAKLFSELKNMLLKVENTISVARELNIEVAAYEDKLAQGKKVLEQKKFKDVLSISVDISNSLAAKLDEVFNELKEKLVELKKLRIDIGDYLGILKDAALRKKEGDLLGAYKKLLETHKKVSGIFEKQKKAYEIISSSAIMIAEAKKNNIDVRAVLEKLIGAKKYYEAHEYEKSRVVAEETKTEIKSLVDKYVSAHRILNIKRHMTTAKKLDIDLRKATTNLLEAIGALKNKDYESALNYSGTADEELTEALKNELSSSLSALQSLITEAKDIGINVSIAEEQFSKSREHLEKGEFDESVEFSISARNEIKRLKDLSKKAASTIKKAQDLINESESMNVLVPKQKDLIEESMKMLEGHDYEDAIKLADEILVDVEKERKSFISNTIANFKEIVIKAKKDGINTASSVKLLNKATRAYKAKKYKEALELAMQSENEIERVSLQQDMALKALNTAKRKIETLQVPAPKSEELLKKGQEALDKGEYVEALEYAIQSGDEIYKVMGLYDEAMGKLQSATKLINDLYKMRINVQKAEELLKKANSSLTAGNFKAASELAEKSVEYAEKHAVEHLNSLTSKFEETLEFAKSQGIEVNHQAQKVAEAKALLAEGNFESTNLLLEDERKELEETIFKNLNETLERTRSIVSHAKNIGADTSESEKLLEEALAALSKNKFEDVIRLVTESEKKVETRKKRDKRFIDLTYQIDSMISKSKKYGVNVKEAEQMLLEALKLKNVDMDMALSIAEKSLEQANKAMEAFAPILDASLSVKQASLNQWVQGEITLVNKGKALAKDIDIKILGDVEVKEINAIPALKAGGTIAVPIRIKLTSSGSVPLAIKLSGYRLLDEKVYDIEKLESVEVSAKPEEKEEGLKRFIAEEDHKCHLCNGVIKKGQPVIQCSCGDTYHEPCAARSKKCTFCGAELTQKANTF